MRRVLTEEQVRDIRREYPRVGVMEFARLYGVNTGTINHVLTGKGGTAGRPNWAGVSDAADRQCWVCVSPGWKQHLVRCELPAQHDGNHKSGDVEWLP